MKDIIILNGPPGCGKDTLCALLENHFKVGTFEVMQVKQALFDAVYEHYNLSYEQVKEFHERYDNRATKEVPWALTNLSVRDMMIHVSEDVYKVKYGQDYFGIKAAEQLDNSTAHVVAFSDGGFPAEIKELCNKGEVFVFRLRGRGSFDGDSRRFVDCTNLPVVIATDILLVDGRPELALEQILNIYQQVRNKEHDITRVEDEWDSNASSVLDGDRPYL